MASPLATLAQFPEKRCEAPFKVGSKKGKRCGAKQIILFSSLPGARRLLSIMRLFLILRDDSLETQSSNMRRSDLLLETALLTLAKT